MTEKVAKDHAVPIVANRRFLMAIAEIVERNLESQGRKAIMRRKLRSDCTVGTAEKKLGLPPGTFRNPDGRDTRSDKKIGTIRKQSKKD